MSEKQLLIDAVFINSGGGVSLLSYLIKHLENRKNITYLLDNRIKKKNSFIPKRNKVFYIKGSILNRHYFYLKKHKSFDKVFCFANIPPSIRLDCEVFTYFHQVLFLNPGLDNGKIDFVIKIIKSAIIKILRKNTDYWIVQTEYMQQLIAKNYDIKIEKIKIFPFYNIPIINKENIGHRIKNQFVYVGLAHGKYKNHKLLIEAFALSYKNNQTGELHLTIDDSNQELIKQIMYYQESNIPIINHGLLDKIEVNKLYSRSEYLIFPSLQESFGLPIIEAIKYGCKVLASKRPYVSEVCNPSLSFDPLDIDDIANCITIAKTNELKESVLKIDDRIKDLVKIIL